VPLRLHRRASPAASALRPRLRQSVHSQCRTSTPSIVTCAGCAPGLAVPVRSLCHVGVGCIAERGLHACGRPEAYSAAAWPSEFRSISPKSELSQCYVKTACLAGIVQQKWQHVQAIRQAEPCAHAAAVHLCMAWRVRRPEWVSDVNCAGRGFASRVAACRGCRVQGFCGRRGRRPAAALRGGVATVKLTAVSGRSIDC
jgi:hypothetical protein